MGTLFSRAISTAFFLTLATCLPAQTPLLPGNIEVSGNTHFEWAVSDTNVSRYFENWSDLFLSKGGFRLGLRFEVHEPPASFASQDTVTGFAHRYLEFRKGGLYLRGGNFYSLLGLGLVLRTFENRTLRWDSNIDGLKVEFRHSFVDLQGIYGKPRKTRLEITELENKNPASMGIRLPALAGGEVKLKPLSQFAFGGTYVNTGANASDVTDEHSQRGSLFGELNLKPGSLYAEYAKSDYPDASLFGVNGEAFYASANFFWGALSLSGEYKYYENFAIDDGLLNNPPTAIKEHLFTLMNRHQLIQNADGEEGYFAGLEYPLIQDGVLSLAYCSTENLQGNLLYEDLYGQFEWSEFLGAEWTWAAGRQKDEAARYYNFVNSTHYAINDAYSLKFVYEHQHARVAARSDFTERQYYDQLVTLGLSKAPTWTLSFLGEHSTDQFAELDQLNPDQTSKRKHHFWAGGQLDLKLWERVDLSIFGGTRREGKICIGGVCVVKPELEGAEVTVIARL